MSHQAEGFLGSVIVRVARKPPGTIGRHDPITKVETMSHCARANHFYE